MQSPVFTVIYFSIYVLRRYLVTTISDLKSRLARLDKGFQKRERKIQKKGDISFLNSVLSKYHRISTILEWTSLLARKVTPTCSDTRVTMTR